MEANGARLYYEVTGSGPETIVFSHGLLMSGEMFRDQVAALGSQYRCILYDHRGQGRSGITDSGYDMDTLAEDAATLIETLDASPCHFVGLSMGGFVGMRLAIRRPDLLRSLVLLNTSADPEPGRLKYTLMAWFARWFGFRLLAGTVMKIMFGRSFLTNPDKREERTHWRRHLVALDRIGTYHAAQGVIRREGIFDELHKVSTPTLVLAGDEDLATVPARAERIREATPGAQMTIVTNAGHSSSVEQAEKVTAAIGVFISQCEPTRKRLWPFTQTAG